MDLFPSSVHDFILSARRFHVFKGKTNDTNRLLIHLVDGRSIQGGLTDRFKGIVSTYCIAQIQRRTYKIQHTSPFDLTDYLTPNIVDWTLRDKQIISQNLFQARLAYFSKVAGLRKKKTAYQKNNTQQIHAYCVGELYTLLRRSDGSVFDWGTEFNKLFRPATDLQKQIDERKTLIGGDYIAVVFRFQNLLGDFEEYQYAEADKTRQEMLLKQCRAQLLDIQRENNIKKILVTSDSVRFLGFVKDLPEVFAFPEKVVHLDWTKSEDYETYLKSFLDFYLIAGADKVFSVSTADMYKSDFPKYAAMVNSVPFERIFIEE